MRLRLLKADERIFITVTYMNILLYEFVGDELNKPIKRLRKKLERYMHDKGRKNRKWVNRALKKGDTAWQKCIDKYQEDEVSIEVYSTINELYANDWELLHQYVGLNEEIMDDFMCTCKNEHSYEVEKNAIEIASYLVKILDEV